jgi:hypothetical protein
MTEEDIFLSPGTIFNKDADLSGIRSSKLLSRIKQVEEAYHKMREAAFQNHSAHFDKTGGSGAGCPECLRIRSLRREAEKIFAG